MIMVRYHAICIIECFKTGSCRVPLIFVKFMEEMEFLSVASHLHATIG